MSKVQCSLGQKVRIHPLEQIDSNSMNFKKRKKYNRKLILFHTINLRLVLFRDPIIAEMAKVVPTGVIITVKTWMVEPCAMKSRISFSGMGEKNTAKTQPLSPFRDRKKNKNFLTLLRGKSNDIAHGSIIQVSTVRYRG